jgi:hypothetical protein
MRDQLLHAVAFRSRVFGVAAHIQIQPRPIAQKDIAASSPRNDAPKQVACYLVRAQSTLTPEGAGDAVFGLNSENAAIHTTTV